MSASQSSLLGNQSLPLQELRVFKFQRESPWLSPAQGKSSLRRKEAKVSWAWIEYYDTGHRWGALHNVTFSLLQMKTGGSEWWSDSFKVAIWLGLGTAFEFRLVWLQSYWFRNWPPIHGGQGKERQKLAPHTWRARKGERGSHFTLGGVKFNKLVLVGCETSRSQQPPECVHSVAQSRLLCDLMDCSLPGSSVHGISKKEYWSGLPFHSPGDLPDPRIEPASLASPALAGGFFTTEPPGKSTPICQNLKKKVDIEALTGHSHVQHPHGLSNISLSQAFVLEICSHCENSEQNVPSKDKGGGWEPLIPWV